MLTKTVQTAISTLYAIASGDAMVNDEKMQLSEILDKLESAELIRKKDESPGYQINSYELTRSMSEISLLDVLEATGEHLNCNYPTTEDFYSRFGRAAQKLGVVNQMTRLYLKEIKLVEL